MPTERSDILPYSTHDPLEILALLRTEIKLMQKSMKETIVLQGDLLEYAWTIIANAGVNVQDNGNGWENEALDWQLAAITWRDRYHELIGG